LEAIKRSFTDSQGRSEIIADIEARIAELFSERVKNEKEVISTKQVDEVIAIMGQPEDYLVDDEIFEDEPKSTSRSKSHTYTSKKLFRDTDNSYIGGVAAGLGHYLGIDAVWVRLLWILLALGSGGTFILIYILFWVLVPEAITTADKLTMTGEPVNISNIEKKIKDGFENVSETVGDVAKNVSESVSGAAKKTGKSVKSSSKTFFDTIGDIIMFFLKVFAKFIGVILIIIGAATLIALIISLFTVGIVDSVNIPGIDFMDAANAANTPIWFVSLLLLFAIGIPFFFVFYLGLKVLVNNLKSIGNVAKFSLLGLWLVSLIGLFIIGIKQASEHAYDESAAIEKSQLNITANDTLYVKMVGNNVYRNNLYRDDNSFRLTYDDNDQKVIYTRDIRLVVKSTTDSLASIAIEKNAEGSSTLAARERAQNINYHYVLVGNELRLDGYLSTDFENKFRDQEVYITLYLPEGATLYADNNTYSFHRNSSYYEDILENGMEEHYLKVVKDGLVCPDCDNDDFKFKVNINDKDSGVKIDKHGLEIKGEDGSLKIDKHGLKGKSEDVKVNIDSSGIEISSDNN
ncbi:MAG TPA: PspC domain-containing protein, partial [Flavobacteriaceae bacterium]|nr:PspC domain-containing protein [Flavobacteriaceae bacterium]